MKYHERNAGFRLFIDASGVREARSRLAEPSSYNKQSNQLLRTRTTSRNRRLKGKVSCIGSNRPRLNSAVCDPNRLQPMVYVSRVSRAGNKSSCLTRNERVAACATILSFHTVTTVCETQHRPRYAQPICADSLQALEVVSRSPCPLRILQLISQMTS